MIKCSSCRQEYSKVEFSQDMHDGWKASLNCTKCGTRYEIRLANLSCPEDLLKGEHYASSIYNLPMTTTSVELELKEFNEDLYSKLLRGQYHLPKMPFVFQPDMIGGTNVAVMNPEAG